MENIEDLIRNNREFFDNDEPREGHLKRFRKRLETGKTLNIRFIIRIAAIVVAGVLVASISNYLINRTNNQEQALSNLNPEVKEAIYYYDNISNNILNKIQNLPSIEEERKKEILNDIENYDKNYESLMEDLNKYPDNEQLIHVLIEHHKAKTELLSHIMEKFRVSGKRTI